MGNKDVRSYLKALESRGLLVTVDRPVNKDTELMPLVRLQYRGLPEEQRRAFLFTNVIGGAGEKYEMPVLVSGIGASRGTVACAMDCTIEELRDTWNERSVKRVPPVMVEKGDAPCKDVILKGADLTGENGGVTRFPIPISTPGFDPSPFITSGHWITKDPVTGIRNVGNYRTMVKAGDRLGIQLIPSQHIGNHFFMHKERGQHMEAAIVIGAPPAVALTAPAKFSYGQDEFEVAGAFAGEPVELVKCETIDMEVPAYAEIVIEGRVRTDVWEDEGPFGEFSGYVGERRQHPFFEITCITHRKNPVFQAFISQFPPSESSKIRQVANEAIYYDTLKNHCNISGLQDVSFWENSGAQHTIVLQLKKRMPSDPWSAMHAAAAIDSTYGKFIIVVDPDINPHQVDSVMWALSTRCQPRIDMKIDHGRASMLDPSAAPPSAPPDQLWYPKPFGASGLMIDATCKWDYPAVSLPTKPHMEQAMSMWKELGLPELTMQAPWHGYELGNWEQEWTDDADLAVQGKSLEVGKKLEKTRVPCDLRP